MTVAEVNEDLSFSKIMRWQMKRRGNCEVACLFEEQKKEGIATPRHGRRNREKKCLLLVNF